MPLINLPAIKADSPYKIFDKLIRETRKFFYPFQAKKVDLKEMPIFEIISHLEDEILQKLPTTNYQLFI